MVNKQRNCVFNRLKQSSVDRGKMVDRARAARNRTIFLGVVDQIRDYESQIADLEGKLKGCPEGPAAMELGKLNGLLQPQREFIDRAYRLAEVIQKQERRNLHGYTGVEVATGRALRYMGVLGSLYILAAHFKDSVSFLRDLRNMYNRARDTGESAQILEKTVVEYLKGKHSGIERLEQMRLNNCQTIIQMRMLRDTMAKVSEECGKYARDLLEYRKQFESISERIIQVYEVGETASMRIRRLEKQIGILKNDVGRLNASMEDFVVNRSEALKKAVDAWYSLFFKKGKDELKQEEVYKEFFDTAFKEVYKKMQEAKNAIDTLGKDISELERACLSLVDEKNITAQQQGQFKEDVTKYGRDATALGKAGDALKETYTQEGALFEKEARYQKLRERYNQIRVEYAKVSNSTLGVLDEVSQQISGIKTQIDACAVEVGKDTKTVIEQNQRLDHELKAVLGDEYRPLYGTKDSTVFGIDQFGIIFALCSVGMYKLAQAIVPGVRQALNSVSSVAKYVDGRVGRFLWRSKAEPLRQDDMQKVEKLQNDLYRGLYSISQIQGSGGGK